MNPAPGSEATLVLALLLVLLVPLANVGLMLINTGLGRSRSAAHSMLASLCVLSVAAIVWVLAGSTVQGYPFALLGGHYDLSAGTLAMGLQVFAVGFAAMIPLGAAAERWRLGSLCASTAIFAGIVYPLFARWVWGGGWLARAGFVDAGGSGVVQVTGGLAALSITWILGPRRGKYAPDGRPTAIPGHHAVFVMAGCATALLGWVGLNGAGAILFAGSGAGAVMRVAIHTMLCAGTGAVTAALVTKYRFGRPDASLSANGWLGGLAASSAGCAWFVPLESVLIGMVAGAAVVLSVELLELRLFIDDPAGAISVHGVGGLWGILAASASGHWIGQMAGIAALLGFVFPICYGLNYALNRLSPQRVSGEAERLGLDLHELGAGAYPEFVTHSDDVVSPRR